MLLDLLWLVVGLVLLLAGGDGLVRGAAALAGRLGVSETIIGLTVVAFGTSAPELVVSLLSAMEGAAGLTFGNVMGSNVANLSLLLGATALLRPLTVQGSLVTREIPLLILASAVTAVVCLDGPFQDGAPAVLARGDGLVLLLLFGVFMYTSVRDVLGARKSEPVLAEAPEVPPLSSTDLALGWTLLLILGGLVGLTLGGNLMVDSAVSIAQSLGVGEVVIGSTIVAVGTSLPELATSILAARKGQGDLAVANVIGSNLFNLLFVLGTTASLLPVPLPEGGTVDLAFGTGLSLLVLPVALTHGRRITRLEGLGLLSVYAGFTAWQLLRDSPAAA